MAGGLRGDGRDRRGAGLGDLLPVLVGGQQPFGHLDALHSIGGHGRIVVDPRGGPQVEDLVRHVSTERLVRPPARLGEAQRRGDPLHRLPDGHGDVAIATERLLLGVPQQLLRVEEDGEGQPEKPSEKDLPSRQAPPALGVAHRFGQSNATGGDRLRDGHVPRRARAGRSAACGSEPRWMPLVCHQNWK